MIILPQVPPEVATDDRVLSPKERRLERVRAWRAANADHLRDYQRKWRTDHPDRIQIHRDHEYENRRKEARRLRLRREAQRRRRAIKRTEAMRLYPLNYCRKN